MMKMRMIIQVRCILEMGLGRFGIQSDYHFFFGKSGYIYSLRESIDFGESR